MPIDQDVDAMEPTAGGLQEEVRVARADQRGRAGAVGIADVALEAA
jgi:hypothetical protein